MREAAADPRARQRDNCDRGFELLGSPGFRWTRCTSRGKDTVSLHAEGEGGTESRDERELQKLRAVGIGVGGGLSSPTAVAD